MNRRTRTLVVIAIAIVCATAATGAVILAARKFTPKPPEVEQVPVVVATRPMPTGVLLTDADLAVVQWPKTSRPKGGFSSIDEVKGRGLLESVAENEPLTAVKVAAQGAGAGMIAKIRPGMRAISVKVNEVIGVAGFVVPGTRVDVLVTIRQNSESQTRMVVSNAEVLTAGTKIDQDQAKDGKPIPTTVVTLMVDPPKAERIALAAAEGQILLTLRNPLDTEATATPGIDTSRLMHDAPRVNEKPGSPAPVRSDLRIEVIKGGARTQEVVR